ncbi:MAG: hypothetical protein ABIH35_01675 [Patescibacteria group bacterium]
MKKFLLVVLLIILTGGAYVAKAAFLDKPADPQAFVRNAFANSFDVQSAGFASKITADVKDVAGFNGKLTLDFSGKIANAMNYLPDLDYLINLNASGSGMGQSGSISTSGNLRILDEVFYGMFSKLEVTGIPAEQLMFVNMAKTFENSWYAVSFKKLREINSEIDELFSQQKIAQEEMRTSLKNFFSTQDFFQVRSLPISLGSIQQVVVTPDVDVLTSTDFLDELERIFSAQLQLPEGADNPFEISEEDKAELQVTLRKIFEQVRPNMTMRIGKKDGILYGYDLNLDLDLAKIEVAGLTEGSITIAMSAQNQNINEPQAITVPADFTEIDPLQFMPTPELTEEEEAVLLELDAALLEETEDDSAVARP